MSWDGDGAFLRDAGFSVEIANFHYPQATSGGRWGNTNPDTEWYEDAIEHFEPFRLREIPSAIGETAFDRPRHLLEGRTYTQLKARQCIAIRALRILGFDDLRPYKFNWAWHDFSPEGKEHPWAPYYHSLTSESEKAGLVKLLKDSCHPIAVFDRDYARLNANPDGTIGPAVLKSGREVERVLVVLNDSFISERPERVTWWVTGGRQDEEIARNSFDVQVDQGSSEDHRISFRVPRRFRGPESGLLTLRIRSEMEGLPQGPFETLFVFVRER